MVPRFIGREMILRTRPAAIRLVVPLACALVFAVGCGIEGWGQSEARPVAAAAPTPETPQDPATASSATTVPATQTLSNPDASSLARWNGLQVLSISFEGVAAARLAPLPGNLAQAVDAPLNSEDPAPALFYRPL